MHTIEFDDSFEYLPKWHQNFCNSAGSDSNYRELHPTLSDGARISLKLFEEYNARFILENGLYEDLSNLNNLGEDDFKIQWIEFPSEEDFIFFKLKWG